MAKAAALPPGNVDLSSIVPMFKGLSPAVYDLLRELGVDVKPPEARKEPPKKELTPDQIEQIRRTLGEDDGFVKALDLHRSMTGGSLKQTRDFIYSLQPPDVQEARKLFQKMEWRPAPLSAC